jgi:hypothetical protein
MKAITPDNYLVRPFLTHKTQIYQYSYLGGSNPVQVSIDLAVLPPTAVLWQFNSSSEQLNSGSGLYSRPLYSSIQNLFYRSGTLANYGNLFRLTGSEAYVVSLAQQTYGQGIQPSSFRLEASLSTASLVDDGNGHIVSDVVPSLIVGNIFYKLGIAVIAKATGSFTASIVSHTGLYLHTGSTVSVQFDASHTIYEHQVYCTMDEGEFNYSTNPSIAAASSSVSGTIKVFDAFASGTLTPYFTTVGLYTNLDQLVAVAKVPRPIKRVSDSQQTVVVKFDV